MPFGVIPLSFGGTVLHVGADGMVLLSRPSLDGSGSMLWAVDRDGREYDLSAFRASGEIHAVFSDVAVR